ALRESGLQPEQLEVEVTETVMMRNVDQVAEVFRVLKNLGVQLTLDDFGTGYSSLTYMKRFPLDAVKIDRSFVRDLPEDADDLAIARAVIAMAHSLRLKVVAEGVETADQMEHLSRLGCDEVQGTYLSAPLFGDEVVRFLSQSTM
ncbi:MAG: EAL domain-containing protein, partial [Betaproteobacteria bacterium]|nr:EAL domain-containing protein [Betaproteobacteria bacterium]